MDSNSLKKKNKKKTKRNKYSEQKGMVALLLSEAVMGIMPIFSFTLIGATPGQREVNLEKKKTKKRKKKIETKLNILQS